MDHINLTLGTKVLYKEKQSTIKLFNDIETATIQEDQSGHLHTVKIYELSNLKKIETSDIELIHDPKLLKIASKRLKIIKPLISTNKTKTIRQVAEHNNLSVATIYRYLKKYHDGQTISSLLPTKKSGGSGESRLHPNVESLIIKNINDHYLNKKKESVSKLIRRIKLNCDEQNLKLPCDLTIRNRLKKISDEDVVRSRLGNKRANELYKPIKSNYVADYPNQVVQIDHTQLDIILVDEVYNKPFRRPWLTVAIDIYSRMIVGFYISFDPPGIFGAGRCIANSVLPKDKILREFNIDSSWPCWGFMDNLHMDNGKDFRSNAIKLASKIYKFSLLFRPVRTPNFGGHIERCCGTLNSEIHNLPGTTFSSPALRGEYDSVKFASMTMKDLERWLLIFIVKVYHKRLHSGIGMSPEQKYIEGIVGNDESPGIGRKPLIIDERELKLNFMPYYERTVQPYGVVLGHIFYFDPILSRYVNSKEGDSRKNNKKKFIFRRDPRDISKLYFFDPIKKKYHDIRYRNLNYPPMSIWVYREVIRKLNDKRVDIDEKSIFKAYRELDSIVKKAEENKRRLNKNSRNADSRNSVIGQDLTVKNEETLIFPDSSEDESDFGNLKPFDDIDYEAL